MAADGGTQQFKPGLVGVTREILLDSMVRHAVQGTRALHKFLVMVTDAEGQRVLGASLKMSELVQEGVTHIEDLRRPRQPRSDMGAIYFIGPTQSSIDRLLFDFRDDGEPMYAEAWVYCTGRIPDDQFEKLKRAGSCFRRANRCCRDLLVEFTPLPTLGGRAFTLGVPELTYDMYSTLDERHSGDTPARHRAVERLFQLCISLGEAPEIAYFDLELGSRSPRSNADPGTSMCIAQVAMELSERLREFRASDASKQYMKKMSEAKNQFLPASQKALEKPHPLLVLLDRSVDPAGPLVHDMSYEGLCHDLLDTDPHGAIKVPVKASVGKTLETTDPADEIWATLRETHFAWDPKPEDEDAVRGLEGVMAFEVQRFEEFKKQLLPSPAATESLSSRWMAAAEALERRREKDRIARLNEVRKKQEQLDLHIALVEALRQEITRRRLLPEPNPCLLEVESELIMGRDGRDGLEAKLEGHTLVEHCQAVLPQLSSEQDKERLLALYWFCHGVREGGDGNMGRLVNAAFPDGPSSRMQQIIEQLVQNGKFCSNLDVKSEKKGTGKKRMVSYGYGCHRRRYTTETDGQERNPVITGRWREGNLVRLQDQWSRYCPSLYWIVKDFVKRGSENPYKKHWKGIDAAGRPQAEYTLQKAMDWSEYGNSETQREHNLAAKGVSTGRLVSKHKGDRMIIICVLGGVTYAEIHQAAEIERRTGCTVLIGGSEVLTRSDYLDRLSMAGDWVNPQQDAFAFDRAVKAEQRYKKAGVQGPAGQQQADCSLKCITMCGMCPLPDDEASVASQPQP